MLGCFKERIQDMNIKNSSVKCVCKTIMRSLRVNPHKVAEEKSKRRNDLHGFVLDMGEPSRYHMWIALRFGENQTTFLNRETETPFFSKKNSKNHIFINVSNICMP